jgi:hypothetical protein
VSPHVGPHVGVVIHNQDGHHILAIGQCGSFGRAISRNRLAIHRDCIGPCFCGGRILIAWGQGRGSIGGIGKLLVQKMVMAERQANREGAAFAFLACYLNRAMMQGNQFLCQGQSNAGARLPPRRGGIGLIEALEQVGYVFGGNARPGILYRYDKEGEPSGIEIVGPLVRNNVTINLIGELTYRGCRLFEETKLKPFMSSDAEKNRNGRLSMNKGIVWGAGIGMIFGAALGNPGIGLVIGAGAGLILGSRKGFG